jgi:hypothetical protein
MNKQIKMQYGDVDCILRTLESLECSLNQSLPSTIIPMPNYYVTDLIAAIQTRMESSQEFNIRRALYKGRF